MGSINRVRGCQPQSMVSFAQDVVTQNASFIDQVDRMDRSVDNATATWMGDGATAASARQLSEKVSGTHIDTAVTAIAENYSSFGTTLGDNKTQLLVVVDTEAPMAGMMVHDDGTVTAPTAPDSTTTIPGMLMQRQLDGQASGFQQRIQTMLTQFETTETQAAAAISTAHGQLSGLEAAPDGAPLSNPVKDIVEGRAELPTDPKQLHDFWRTLTPAEKDALYDKDQYIGNRDGIPVIDRDHYNRMKVDDELTRAQSAQAAVEGWEAKYPQWLDGETPSEPPANASRAWKDAYADYVLYQQAKDQAKNLTDIESVNAAVDGKPDRQLLLFDTQTGDQPRAAVAVGNPDTAQNVSVTTPGLNTTVGSLGGMADEATAVQREAQRQLNDEGRGAEGVSTIAWIGYDPPQIAGQDLAGQIVGGWDVSRDEKAQEGAVDLANFYDGIAASNNHDDPHITAIGHSYGSLTTGLALQQPGDHPVDDVIVYGSPGIQASNPGDLGVDNGHVYVMRADDDPISWAQDGPRILDGIFPGVTDLGQLAGFGDLGPDPATNSNFTRLDTDASTTADGRHLDGASGHSEYPRMGSNGQLRTPGYNISAVVAGIADNAVVAK